MIPIMLLQSNMTLLICTSFYYNQNYIEKYLCVQRSMKNNSCHGQCYLMKKIKAQQENEQENFKVHFHEALAIDPAPVQSLLPITVSLKKEIYNLYTSNLYPQDYLFQVFQPPIFA